jgi:hypothetical protein
MKIAPQVSKWMKIAQNLQKWMKIMKTGPHFKLAQNCIEAGTLNANCTEVTLIG